MKKMRHMSGPRCDHKYKRTHSPNECNNCKNQGYECANQHDGLDGLNSALAQAHALECHVDTDDQDGHGDHRSGHGTQVDSCKNFGHLIPLKSFEKRCNSAPANARKTHALDAAMSAA